MVNDSILPSHIQIHPHSPLHLIQHPHSLAFLLHIHIHHKFLKELDQKLHDLLYNGPNHPLRIQCHRNQKEGNQLIESLLLGGGMDTLVVTTNTDRVVRKLYIR